MNITFITPSLKTGGGNRVFFEIASRMSGEHSVTILAPNNSPDMHTFSVAPTVQITTVGEVATSKLSQLRNIFRTIRYANRNFCNDTIVYSDPLFSLAGSLLKGRCYRFIQADDYRIFDDGFLLGDGVILKVYKFLCKMSYLRRHVRFIFNSRYTYDCFLRISGRPEIPYHLVHPALSAGTFSATRFMRGGVFAL